jgi:hypothetical protein
LLVGVLTECRRESIIYVHFAGRNFYLLVGVPNEYRRVSMIYCPRSSKGIVEGANNI